MRSADEDEDNPPELCYDDSSDEEEGDCALPEEYEGITFNTSNPYKRGARNLCEKDILYAIMKDCRCGKACLKSLMKSTYSNHDIVTTTFKSTLNTFLRYL